MADQPFLGEQYPRTPSRVDPAHPPWPSYRGYHEYSFAHATMSHRLPTILGKAIEDVVKTLADEYDEERITDLTACIERMEDLMEDLQGNSKLRPIIDDGEGDIPLWNKEIAKVSLAPSSLSLASLKLTGSSSPVLPRQGLYERSLALRRGLQVPCIAVAPSPPISALLTLPLLTGRLHECFSMSKHWKSYDVFFRQKCETFSRSGDAVFELSTRFAEPYLADSKLSDEDQLSAKKLLFLELTQVALWGNATDLSLLIDVSPSCRGGDLQRLSLSPGVDVNESNLPSRAQMSEDDIKKLQSTGGDHLAATEKNSKARCLHIDLLKSLTPPSLHSPPQQHARDLGSRLLAQIRWRQAGWQDRHRFVRSFLPISCHLADPLSPSTNSHGQRRLRALLRHDLRRLPHRQRPRLRSPLSWQAFRLVRLGRHGSRFLLDRQPDDP